MKPRSFAPAVAFVLLAGAMIVPAANAVGRPTCLVSNERSGLGTRSLQAAVDAAAPGDTLVIKGTCFGSTTIAKSLTLRGRSNPAFGVPTLDGGGTGRVLFVDFFDADRRAFTLTVENLTITHGLGEDGNGGGGLLVQGGTIELRNSIVTGNSAGVLGGGGIQAHGGVMTLTNTTVSDNSAGDGGGGIYGGGVLTLNNSTVTGNTSRGLGGGLDFRGGTLTIRDSMLTGNSAFAGGAIFHLAGSVMVANSTLSANRADHGGGIYNADNSPARHTTMLIRNTNVSGNEATDGEGGGILNRGDLTLENSTVNGNNAATNGGGVANVFGTLNITSSVVSGNRAHTGGGIASFFGDLTFASPPTTVGGNTATIGGGVLYVVFPVADSVTGACPTTLGGHVLYSPANNPTDYSGFSCPAPGL